MKCMMRKDGGERIGRGDLGGGVRGVVEQIKSFEGVAAEGGVRGD